ncbi:MAG: phosphatase [Burkholderiales bacterium PBB5]|nr:MAG: phosphatase [Burkholderiales bacterium PBB5]
MPLERSAFLGPGDDAPRPHDNCYWLVPGRLLAGQHPGGRGATDVAGNVAALLASGIRQTPDLTSPGEGVTDYQALIEQQAAARGWQVRVLRAPVTDYGLPDAGRMRWVLDQLHSALEGGPPLYLHCHGGIGRTGTAIGCLLVEQGFSGDEALALIACKWQVMEKRHRAPESPETDAQRDFIRHWQPGAGAG